MRNKTRLTMAEQKETVILEFEVDSKDAVQSIDNLTKANKALREERKKLDTSTEEGRNRIKQINSEIDKNTNTIKDNSSALEKQRLNVGNYSGALDKLIPGLGATANGFVAMGKAMYTAVVANPIGAIITAIVVAVGALVKAFTSTEAGGDLLAKRMAQLGAVFNVIMDRAGALGGALVKLFTGDFIGAIEDTKKAFTGVTAEIVKEAEAAGKLAEIIDELGNRELDYNVAASKTENIIKQKIIASKNSSLTEAERINLLKEATELEVKQNAVIKKINEDKVKVALEKLLMDNSQLELTRLQGETELEFAQRIFEQGELNAEARGVKMESLEELGDAIINYNTIEGQSLTLQEKINTQMEIRKEAEIKAREALAKKAEEEAKRKAASLNEYYTMLADVQKAQEEKDLELWQAQKKREEESQKMKVTNIGNLAAIVKKAEEEDTAAKLAKAEWEKKTEFEKIDAIWAKFLEKHEKEIAAINQTLQVSKEIIGGIGEAYARHYALQEQALQISLAKQKTAIQTEFEEEKKALDAKYEAGEISKEEYDDAIMALNQKYQADVKEAEIAQQKELNDIKKKAFEANKKVSIAQALIDAAMAVLKSLASLPFPANAIVAAATAALAAIQIIQIKKQEFVPTTFAQGGYTGDGDKYEEAGTVHKGEFVMPQESVKKYGKETFQSYLDGSVATNGMMSGASGGSQMGNAPVYVVWKEMREFDAKMMAKAEIVEAR